VEAWAAARKERRIGRLARQIQAFAGSHGGGAEANLAYVGERGTRIVLVASNGSWGDLVAPTYEMADMSAVMIETPAAHHGTVRPARKKSSSDFCFLVLLKPMYSTTTRYESRIRNRVACRRKALTRSCSRLACMMALVN